MAIHVPCGTSEPNETDAIRALSDHSFGDEWALLTNIPRTVVPREIDACLLGPKGMIVLELKNHAGVIRCRGIGPWEGIPEIEGNPLEQAEACAQKLKRWLTERDPSLEGKVYIDSLVVMTHPRCQLAEIGQEIADRVGSLRDIPVLVGGRLREGLGVGVPERIFTLITGRDPSPELMKQWQNAKRLVRRKSPIRKEAESESETIDALRRIQVLANELERADPFAGHERDVTILTNRYNRLSDSNCADGRFIPSVDGFLGDCYIQDFMAASEKDFDEFKQLQIEYENGKPQFHGSRSEPGNRDAFLQYHRGFVDQVNSRGTRWRFYGREEIRKFGVAGLAPDARSLLMKLADSYFEKYAALYDQALAIVEAVAARHDRVQGFRAAYERMTAPSADKANDLPPEWGRGWYRGWPEYHWVAGPILIAHHTKNRLRIMSDLLVKLRELLELCQ